MGGGNTSCVYANVGKPGEQMNIFIKNLTYVAFNKRAFTLIELLVVVAIIGILAP